MRHRRSLPARLLGVASLVLMAASPGAATAAAAPGHFSAHGSVRQVYVTGVTSSAPLALVDRRGHVVARRRADSLGAALFRNLKPARGYHVRQRVHGVLASSRALRVLPDAPAPPSTASYRQRLPTSGYGYLTTRDGTRLAIDVRLPLVAGRGPYPTLVEYGGYGYPNPAGPQSGIP